MDKEIEKKLKELFELLLNNKENKDFFLKNKSILRKDCNKIIDESENVFVCMNKKDFIACGTTKDILYAIFASLESMIENQNVPREAIVMIFDRFIRK